MGWCTAGSIFDVVAEEVVGLDITDEDKLRVLGALKDELERLDWDCQCESRYYKHKLVRRLFKRR